MFPEVLPLATLAPLLRESLSLPKTSTRLITDEITDEPYNVRDPAGAGMSIKSMGECRPGPRSMCVAPELRAVALSSSYQFDEEIGVSSS
jgi:hypothetical protein